MSGATLVKWIAWVLVIIGGLNLGLYGLFRINVVEDIFGIGMLGRLIFILIGIAALYMIYAVINKNKTPT